MGSGELPGRTAVVTGASRRIGLAIAERLWQNIPAAARVGIAGVVHRDAATTRTELASLLVRVVPA